MPRRRRVTTRSASDVTALEQEMEQLKQRQAELRALIRQQRRGAGGVEKLQERLERQLGRAKWTVQEIRAIQPDWDEWGFYRSVQPQQPAPRGRRGRQE